MDTPLVGSSKEQQLRLQGVGERHIEQLAFALGEVARVVAALCRQAELVEDRIGLVGNGVIEVGEGAKMRGLAFAREDCQRHVVEGGEIVEHVDGVLEAARDASPDALRHGQTRDVLAFEDDLARLLASAAR